MLTAFPALIVGESPSATSDPERPLSGKVGRRLTEWLGAPVWECFALANLLDRFPGKSGPKGAKFPIAEARAAAVRLAILLESEPAPSRLILLGKRVAAAFGERRLAELPFVWAERTFGPRPVRVAVVPHPSTINSFYNDPKNVERARAFLRDAARSDSWTIQR